MANLKDILQEEELRGWFEANYLDGDKIQDGQTLSSEECFDAITSSHHRIIQSVIDECEGMKTKIDASDARKQGNARYRNSAFDEVIAFLQSNLSTLNESK